MNNLYVDSDILLQYKDGCNKIDKGTVEELVNNIEKAYDNPTSGKSYLKWCNIGYNKKRRVSLWRW